MPKSRTSIAPRVTVSVSNEMANLRKIQGALNGFWQTSDLSYGFLLSSKDLKLADKTQKTFDVLGHLDSSVWYLNNQGRIKYDGTIENALNQAQENAIHLYRSTLLSFYSAFESYLVERVDPILPKKKRHHRWGPFVETLSIEPLVNSQYPVQLKTILCADLIREIRNKIIHEAFSVPVSIQTPFMNEWKEKQSMSAINAGWSKDIVSTEISFAANQVVGQAINHVKTALKEGRNVPIELFYMLFTFTNLDSLAFEIEEALLPFNDKSGSQISRKKSAVRRRDLILSTSPA